MSKGNYGRSLRKSYVGNTYKSNSGGTYTVIADLGQQELYPDTLPGKLFRMVEIEWEGTGTRQIVRTSHLKTGALKDRYAPSVQGVGCLGCAENYSKKEYDIWFQMIHRCYNPINNEYYNYGGKGVTVCKRWLCLEYFLEDLRKMENYDKLMAGEKYQLDKDILQQGIEPKIYSPETCLLVSAIENTSMVMLERLKTRDVPYFGVYAVKTSEQTTAYIARMQIYGKMYNLGTYDTAEAAAAVRNEACKRCNMFYMYNPDVTMTYEEALRHACKRYNSYVDPLIDLPNFDGTPHEFGTDRYGNKVTPYFGVIDATMHNINPRFIARINVGGNNYNLGTYDSAAAAATVWDTAALMYGRYNNINHSGITLDMAMQHRVTNDASKPDVFKGLPNREMCTVSKELREMCVVVK